MDVRRIIVGPITTNCYIASFDGKCFLVDPGDEPSRILKEIGSMHLEFILLTHGHFDHVLALDEVCKAYPKAVVYISKNDQGLIKNLSAQTYFLGKEILDINTPAKAVGQGDKIKFAGETIKVISTPGHTSGSVCYLLNDTLFSGDTLFYHSIGRTDLPTSDDIDMLGSLKKLSSLPLETQVLPGHGQQTTIGEEVQNGFLAKFS